MAPLSPPAPAREVAFMGRDSCPPASPHECIGLRLLTSTTATLVHPPLVGLVSTEDGTTNFLDVLKRRFFNDTRDTGTAPPIPQFISFTLTPAPAPGTDATTLSFASSDSSSASKQLGGWINAGVTRSGQWRAIWHAVMPGLESLGGSLSRAAGSPTVSLRLPPGKGLAPWTSAPELQLGAPTACTLPYPQCVGDFVHVLSYSRTDTCAALGAAPSLVDVPIAAIDPDGFGMQLQAVPGFDPGPECFASGDLGGTFEVRAGTTVAGAWTVFEGLDALGRLPHGSQMVITGPRVDYPLDSQSPRPGRDIVVSFTISGPEPTFAGTFFSFTVNDEQAITGVRDGSNAGLPRFAGPILVYNSPRHTDDLVFTALTGSNSLMVATPAQFGVLNSNSVFFFY